MVPVRPEGTVVAHAKTLPLSNVVTVNFDQPAVFVDLRITEYSRLRSTSPDGDLVEDAIVPASGSYCATAPLNGGTWLLQLAAFRAQ